MTKCKNCGKEHDGDFCPFCGTRAEKVAVCPKCGEKLEEGAKFCGNCGNEISEAAAPEARPEVRKLKNETKRDVEFTARMNYYMVGKRSRIMLFVCALVLILLAGWIFGYNYLMTGGEDYKLSLVIFLVLLGVIFFIFALVQKSSMRKAVQNNMQGKEATNLYTFTEDGYEVVTRLNDGTVSRTWGNYGGFTEAKEFADMWLLYVNKAMVFPVAKDGMREGTAEELSALFVRMMGERYKVCYKK